MKNLLRFTTLSIAGLTMLIFIACEKETTCPDCDELMVADECTGETACPVSGDTLCPAEALVGAYSMIKADCLGIPYVISSDVTTPPPGTESCFELYTGGWLTLSVDAHFEMIVDEDAIVCDGRYRGGSARMLSGTYSVDGDSVRFIDQDVSFGGVAFWDCGAICLTLSSRAYIYERLEFFPGE